MKRTTELKRTPFKRSLPSEPKPAPGPRKRKCSNKACRVPYMFDPLRPHELWCSADCAVVLAVEKIAKMKAKQQRQERAADKLKREGMKTYPQLIREAQKAFNAFIRARDEAYPCICCGNWAADDALIGGGWDAGHYLSRGSHPHLRFDERNVFKQRKGCNRPGGTTAAAFRQGVINRIGREVVEALEATHAARKWTHDELRELKAHYQRKVLELKKERA